MGFIGLRRIICFMMTSLFDLIWIIFELFDRPYRKVRNCSLRWTSSCRRWIERRKTTKKLSGKRSGPRTRTAKPMPIWTSRGPTSKSSASTRPSKVTSAMTTKTSTPSNSRKPTSFRRVIIRCVGNQRLFVFHLFYTKNNKKKWNKTKIRKNVKPFLASLSWLSANEVSGPSRMVISALKWLWCCHYLCSLAVVGRSCLGRCCINVNMACT